MMLLLVYPAVKMVLKKFVECELNRREGNVPQQCRCPTFVKTRPTPSISQCIESLKSARILEMG